MDTTTCIFFIIPMMSFSSLGADSIGQANGSSLATSRLGGKSRPGSSAKKTGVRPYVSFYVFRAFHERLLLFRKARPVAQNEERIAPGGVHVVAEQKPSTAPSSPGSSKSAGSAVT